jgi:hypothetical protein
MEPSKEHGVTRRLRAWSDGPDAPEQLMPLVYEELRRLAGVPMLRERATRCK